MDQAKQDRDRRITVRPVGGGWCVASSDTGELMFLSGARAEEKARALAACFAELGSDVHLEVHDLRDQLVATRRYFGDNAAQRLPVGPVLEPVN